VVGMGEMISTTAYAVIKYDDPEGVHVEFVVKVPKEVLKVFRIDYERTDYVVFFEDEGRWIIVRLFRKDV
jgi:uncharacterized SAM-dependent methyltransferase